MPLLLPSRLHGDHDHDLQSESSSLLQRWGPLCSDKLATGRGSEDVVYGAELDPLGFSFFLSANLPVSCRDAQRLLEAEDAVDRLR